MDIVSALSVSMLPIILIFLFIDVFDTAGTLIAVGEQERVDSSSANNDGDSVSLLYRRWHRVRAVNLPRRKTACGEGE